MLSKSNILKSSVLSIKVLEDKHSKWFILWSIIDSNDSNDS